MSTLNVDTLANELGTGGPDFVGMPTVQGDPVVESGSNSDGNWTRWADGTQHCHTGAAHKLLDTAIEVSGIGRSGSATWQFPVPFISAPDAASNLKTTASSRWAAVAGTTPTSLEFQCFSAVTSPTQSQVSVSAFGRWK